MTAMNIPTYDELRDAVADKFIATVVSEMQHQGLRGRYRIGIERPPADAEETIEAQFADRGWRIIFLTVAFDGEFIEVERL
jgi:hypothetical protein